MLFFFLKSRTKPQQYKRFKGLFLTAVTCLSLFFKIPFPPSCYIMKFLGCYLTIATVLEKMKIVTWVIPYARDGSNTSAGSVVEVLTLRFSHGIGDMLTSPACFGTKSKLGFLPWPGHSVALCRPVMGSVALSDGSCQAVLSGRWHGREANCVQVKSRQSQGPWAWWAALGSTGAGFPLVMFGDAGGEEQSVLRGNPTAWSCQGKESVTPQDKKQGGIRHWGWQDLITKEVAAKAGEEKWLESVKAVDRGGRGWVAGRGEACFKMTGTIWFMLTHSTSQFGRSANKLGHLMQALLRETWKNG